MMIGIIGAMEEEVALLKQNASISRIERHAGLDYYAGKIGSTDVVLVQCGAGKVNAAICTQAMIDAFPVTHILNTGVAGSLDSSLKIGDIVVSTDAVQHDYDLTAFGKPKGRITIAPGLGFPADPYLRQKAVQAARSIVPGIQVKEGRICSGDQFIASEQVKKSLADEFHGLCAEMEGGAIAQAAWLNQVPFVIIRAISDDADNAITYETFEQQAAEHCCRIVEYMIQSL